MADAHHTPDTSQGAASPAASPPRAGSQPFAGTQRPAASSDTAIVLFDGACNLCGGFVRFIIRRDRAARFRFAPLQSAEARDLLAAHEPGRTARGNVTAKPSTADQDAVPARMLDTVVLLQGGQVHVRSGAALRILRRLGFPWSMLSILLAVPRPVRDAIYDWIARRRYRWFGRRDSCAVPPALRSRFLDLGDD